MKILIVSENDHLRGVLHAYFALREVAIIHYRNPVKAMDNMEEIDPDVVLFSAEDFPRHWKAAIRLLRELREKDSVVFVLLTSSIFPAEEAAKASHLEVSGIIPIEYDEETLGSKIEELISRYIDLPDSRIKPRYRPQEYDVLEFIFNHPKKLSLVPGKILDLTEKTIRFRPENTAETGDLAEGSQIPSCSMQIGEEILSFTCTILRNQENMVLEIIDPHGIIGDSLRVYMQNRTRRSLDSILHHNS